MGRGLHFKYILEIRTAGYLFHPHVNLKIKNYQKSTKIVYFTSIPPSITPLKLSISPLLYHQKSPLFYHKNISNPYKSNLSSNLPENHAYSKKNFTSQTIKNQSQNRQKHTVKSILSLSNTNQNHTLLSKSKIYHNIKCISYLIKITIISITRREYINIVISNNSQKILKREITL